MQAPSSRIPPRRAATIAGDLYKPCAYLHEYHYIFRRRRQPLGTEHGFTDEELDFIINYDIKYRMGRESEQEVE
jgi:hypothetical protein